MSDRPVPGSFRDPSGFLFRRDGTLYRQVNRSYREHYDRLRSSGLYDDLTGSGLLVEHTEADVEPAAPGAHVVIEPREIGFVSYPYEWSFSMLKDAALLTLEVQRRAVDRGMWLQDASAYNVQFVDGRPILIDTLSFEGLREGQPWGAYGQFCRHFLAPLALAAKVDVRLIGLLRLNIDGVPLSLAAAALPRRTRYRAGLGLHIHQHARAERRSAGVTRGSAPKRTFSMQALRGLLSSLEGTVRKLDWEPEGGWVSYYAAQESYSDEALDHKRELVSKLLDDAAPSSVWDLGANTGAFGRIAAGKGIGALCFEMDPGCVEANYRKAKADGDERILPLVCDLTNPSPALGWAHAERSALADRGPADCLLALALIHHLAIGNNVPLDRIASFFASLGRWAIVEWVPKSDPMVDRLLAVRDDIFHGYTQDGFEAAFGREFSVERREPVRSSERTLYLLRRT